MSAVGGMLSSLSGLETKTSRVSGTADTGSQSSVQSAWLREMERAQMDGWLDHPLTPGRQEQGKSFAKAPDAGVVRRLPVPAAPLLMMSPTPLPADAAIVIMPVQQQVLAVNGLSAAALRTATIPAEQSLLMQKLNQLVALNLKRPKSEGTTGQLEPAFPFRDELQSSDTHTAEVSATRVTLEWVGKDVRLWLGIGPDDGLSATQLETMLMQSRMLLAAEGVQLLSATCNGNLIYQLKTHIGSREESQPASIPEDAASGDQPHFFYSYFSRQEA